MPGRLQVTPFRPVERARAIFGMAATLVGRLASNAATQGKRQPGRQASLGFYDACLRGSRLRMREGTARILWVRRSRPQVYRHLPAIHIDPEPHNLVIAGSLRVKDENSTGWDLRAFSRRLDI